MPIEGDLLTAGVTAPAAGNLAVPPAQLSQDTASWLGHGQPTAGFTTTGLSQLQDQHDQAFWRANAQLPASASITVQHTATTDPTFAPRTTDGGALVFYATNATLRITAPAGQTTMGRGHGCPGGESGAGERQWRHIPHPDPPIGCRRTGTHH